MEEREMSFEKEVKEARRDLHKTLDKHKKMSLIDKKKDEVIEELMKMIEEEFINGAEAMLNYLKREVTGCYNKNDNCLICTSGNRFLKQYRIRRKNELE